MDSKGDLRVAFVLSGIERCVVCAGLFAGTPAPTGTLRVSDPVITLWERACPRIVLEKKGSGLAAHHHLARVGQGLLGQVDAAEHPRHFFHALTLAKASHGGVGGVAVAHLVHE